MATDSTGADVSLADVYGLLLDDIRRNWAVRGADLGAAVSYIVALADDKPDRADETQQTDQTVRDED